MFFEILCTWKGNLSYQRAVRPGINNSVHLAYWFMANNTKNKVLGSVILPAALYGCEIWSFTYTEVRTLRIVENVVIEGYKYFEHRQEK